MSVQQQYRILIRVSFRPLFERQRVYIDSQRKRYIALPAVVPPANATKNELPAPEPAVFNVE